MNKKLKILLITLLVLAILIAVPLIVLSFGRVQPGYIALSYDNIISSYSSNQVFGPGNHFIGVARQFIRIRQGPIMVNVEGSTYTSDYFRLKTKITVNYQISTPNDFNAVSNFYLNFGDDSQKIIQSIINKKTLSILSQFPSSFFKNNSYNSSALQTHIETKLNTVFQYEIQVPLQIQVLIESLVVSGASQNIESIEQQIATSLQQLQRAQNQKTQISNFISKVKDRSQQELNLVFQIIKQRTQLVSTLIDKKANYGANFDLSMFLLGNNLIKNNLTYFNTALKLSPQLYTLDENTVF